MRRTSLAEASINELRAKINRAKRRKKHLQDYLNRLHLSYAHKKISYAQYIEILHKKTDKRNINESIQHYDHIIKECEKEIKKHKSHIHKNRSFGFFIFTIILTILFLSYNFLQPTITGFFTQPPSKTQTQSFTESLSLNFNESTSYQWEIKNPGTLNSLKVSGLIELLKDSGNVKIYLDDFLILSSSDLNYQKSQPQTSPITGASIAPPNETQTNTLRNNSNSEELNKSEALANQTNETSPSHVSNESLDTSEVNGTANQTANQTERVEESNIEGNIMVFTDFCQETCDLSFFNLNKTSYTLKIEIENAALILNEIAYEILKEIPDTEIISEEIEEDLIQHKATLNQPVKWTKIVSITNLKNSIVDIPKEAENIEVNKISKERVEFILNDFPKEKEIAFSEIGNFEIIYETPAPISKEQTTKRGKRLHITSPEDLHYTNVLISANLSENLNISKNSVVKIHWIEQGIFLRPKEIKDSDDDGIYDYVEFVAPTLSNQTFEIIVITKAEHLDKDREFIRDIFNETKELDDLWSEAINNDEYVRVTFETPLNSNRDITIFPRVISGNPVIEIYEFNGSEIIATFDTINSNQYNKVFLTGLIGEQDTFDLKILNGEVELDHIIDPTGTYEILGESGSVDIENFEWHLVEFSNTYTSPPIVITSPVTENAAGGGDEDNYLIPTINMINETHFNVTICQDAGSSTCDSTYVEETLHYFVFDVNATLPSWMAIGVDTIDSTDNADTSVSWGKTFSNAPYVWVQSQTYSQSGTNLATQGWTHSITTTGANFKSCFHQGTGNNCDSGLPDEDFGWVAIDVANADFSSLVNFQSGSVNVNGPTWSAISWTSNYTNTRLMVSMNGDSGGQDPKWPWARDVDTSTPDVRMCEQDGANDCDTHNTNPAVWFAMEEGTISTGEDTEAPLVNITSPLNQTYATTAIDFNITLDEEGYCEFTLDGGATNYTMTANSTNTGFNHTNTSMIETQHTMIAYCNDTLGNNNYTESVTFTVELGGNSPPTIDTVNSISAQDPSENTTKSITFNFTATDTDGFTDIDTTTAVAYFQKTGETTRSNSSCINVTTGSGNDLNFTCTIDMWYFDDAGDWTINVSIQDTSAEYIENASTTFTYNLLTAMMMLPTDLSWTTIDPADTDTGASNNPILINNTGNAEDLYINITAYDLQGESNANYYIYAANFTIENATDGCSGTTMSNATSLNITSAILQRGNHSLNFGNETSGQEQLYFCIKGIPSGTPAQSYSTSAFGAWEIRILLVAILPKTNRKRKNKLKKNNRILRLIISMKNDLRENYSKEKEKILKDLTKAFQEEYKVQRKELISLIKQPIEIPLTIFSKELGGLEAISKYMKENLNMSYKEISQTLERDERTIWTAYKKASEKQKKNLEIGKTGIKIPIRKFKEKLTIFENVISYLKSKKLKYIDIAKSLGRDSRNVRTIHLRAVDKMKRNV